MADNVEKEEFESINFEIESLLVKSTQENSTILLLDKISNNTLDALLRKKCQVVITSLDNNYFKEIKNKVTGIFLNKIEDINEKLTKEKFDIIYYSDWILRIREPNVFLRNIQQFLSLNGKIIFKIPNISFGSIRLKLLDGNFTYHKTGIINKEFLRFFTIDTFLIFLSENMYKITKLSRLERDFITIDKNLKPYIIHQNVIESILKDPESRTICYLIVCEKTKDTNEQTRKLLLTFEKNRVTETLNNKLNSYNNKIIELREKISNEGK